MNHVTTAPLRAALLAILTLPLAGWTTPVVLKPVPDAQLVPNSDAAVSVRDGVRMTVDASAWTGKPGTLKDGVIPLKVTIENLVSKPIRVRYSEMVLHTPGGAQRNPLSLKASGDSTQQTRAMTELALPEGLVAAGEFTEGFVYFPQLPEGTERVTFSAAVLEGQEGDRIGKLDFQFVIG